MAKPSKPAIDRTSEYFDMEWHGDHQDPDKPTLVITVPHNAFGNDPGEAEPKIARHLEQNFPGYQAECIRNFDSSARTTTPEIQATLDSAWRQSHAMPPGYKDPLYAQLLEKWYQEWLDKVNETGGSPERVRELFHDTLMEVFLIDEDYGSYTMAQHVAEHFPKITDNTVSTVLVRDKGVVNFHNNNRVFNYAFPPVVSAESWLYGERAIRYRALARAKEAAMDHLMSGPSILWDPHTMYPFNRRFAVPLNPRYPWLYIRSWTDPENIASTRNDQILDTNEQGIAARMHQKVINQILGTNSCIEGNGRIVTNDPFTLQNSSVSYRNAIAYPERTFTTDFSKVHTLYPNPENPHDFLNATANVQGAISVATQRILLPLVALHQRGELFPA